MVFRYPEDPSQKEEAKVRRRRRLAFATLNRNDVFEWKGPSLHPNSLAPRQNTANSDRRTLIDILLSKRSPARSEQDDDWTLTLLEALWVPKDPEGDRESSSQVWRCRAQRGGVEEEITSEMTVVLKLFLPGIYRHGFRGMRWTNEQGLLEDEAIAYERFKALQGINVPFCYGFYNFDLPAGLSLNGIVLEDLTLIGTDLHTFTERLTDVQPDHAEQMKFIDHMFCEAIRTCHRLNSCGVSLVGSVGGNDMIVLRPLPTKTSPFQASQPTKMVFIGFGLTYKVEESKESLRTEEYGDVSQESWLYHELSLLSSALSYCFGDERILEWRKMERERKSMREYCYYL